MKVDLVDTLYAVHSTKRFDRSLKSIYKQGKGIKKLINVVEKLANDEVLEEKYHDHNLVNDKYYQDCRECHIEPDWLLIYRKQKDDLVLVLVETGSHSNLF